MRLANLPNKLPFIEFRNDLTKVLSLTLRHMEKGDYLIEEFLQALDKAFAADKKLQEHLKLGTCFCAKCGSRIF